MLHLRSQLHLSVDRTRWQGLQRSQFLQRGICKWSLFSLGLDSFSRQLSSNLMLWETENFCWLSGNWVGNIGISSLNYLIEFNYWIVSFSLCSQKVTLAGCPQLQSVPHRPLGCSWHRLPKYCCLRFMRFLRLSRASLLASCWHLGFSCSTKLSPGQYVYIVWNLNVLSITSSFSLNFWNLF